MSMQKLYYRDQKQIIKEMKRVLSIIINLPPDQISSYALYSAYMDGLFFITGASEELSQERIQHLIFINNEGEKTE